MSTAVRPEKKKEKKDAAPAAAAPADSGRGSAVVRVVRALARVEARRLLRHPSFVIGTALTILLVDSAGYTNILPEVDSAAVVALAIMGWATLIATNLAALRSRRDGTDELFDSLPTPVTARTAAHLVSGLGAVPVAVLVLGGYVAYLMATGSIGSPNVAELLVGPLLVAGGAALGVLVARWAPHPLVAPLVVVATVFMQGKLSESEVSPFRWMAFSVDGVGLDDGNPFPGQVDWHVLFLLGTVAIAAALALGRHGFSRRVTTFLVGAVVVSAVAAFAQTRPLSDGNARRQALALTAPELACEVRGGVRYCVEPGYEVRFGQWDPPVQAVLARVPGSVRERGLVVSMREPNVVGNQNCTPKPMLEQVPAPVRALVTPEQVWPADNAVHPWRYWPWDPGCSFTDHGTVLTVQVGSWAVGLPPAQSATPPCVASGQARSVLALWLAGQSTPGAPAALAEVLRTSERLGSVDTIEFDSNNWPNWGVAFAHTDVAAALALLQRPGDDVGRIVSANWDRLTDPSTPSSDLTALVGLPGPAPAVTAPSSAVPACP
ncbi:MAG: hypothetical protein QOE93_1583 [Actinomycetota bacterium]|nr:hypothetical protein [Actinomycetota bacterium]